MKRSSLGTQPFPRESNRAPRRLASWCAALLRDTRGNVDPRVGMLMLGVGILSVLGVLPFVLNSAERAGQTMTDQVTVLQRGASPSGNGRLGAGGNESQWRFGVSPSGLKVEKTGGVVGGSLEVPFNNGGGGGNRNSNDNAERRNETQAPRAIVVE